MADQLARLTRLMEDIDDVSLAQEHRIDLDLAEEGYSVPPTQPCRNEDDNRLPKRNRA